MKLRPYQDAGATWIYERDRSMILAPVGAGKTALTLTAISDMLRDKVCTRVLVIAPKRVCTDVWPQECKIWTPHLSIAVAVGTPTVRDQAFRSKAQVVVSNYDNVQKLASLASFDCVVFDELTRFKNPSGKRFKAFLPLIEHINIRIGLTGSFTSNGLEDTFGQCKIVDQALLGRSKGAFLQQYFIMINPEYGEWIPRAGSLAKVMERIKPATFLLDPGVYKDKLAALHVVPVKVDMEKKEYNLMKTKFKAEFPTGEMVAANAAVVTGKLKQIASGFIYDTVKAPSTTPGKWITTSTPHWYNTAKFDRLEELLDENQRANTILVYWYKEELAELQRRYPKAITLDDTDATARWNSGAVELLLVHPRSAGAGLNLQHGGCHMVFLTLPYYSQELFEQTYGRLHRTGQKHAVWVYVMLTSGTVDEIEWAALDTKKSLSELAMECLK